MEINRQTYKYLSLFVLAIGIMAVLFYLFSVSSLTKYNISVSTPWGPFQINMEKPATPKCKDNPDSTCPVTMTAKYFSSTSDGEMLHLKIWKKESRDENIDWDEARFFLYSDQIPETKEVILFDEPKINNGKRFYSKKLEKLSGNNRIVFQAMARGRLCQKEVIVVR